MFSYRFPFAALESVNLEEMVHVTDAAVIALAECCPELRTVKLAYCRALTDAAVGALAAGCKQLRTLDLSHCNGVC